MLSLHPLLVACTGLLALGTLPEPPADPAPGTELVGQVLDAVSGGPVEGAQIVLLETRLGTRTTGEGSFRLQTPPGPSWEGELQVRHPCFHTVRIQISQEDFTAPLVVGLPFRTPRSADGTVIPIVCGAYGPSA
jgi:hypothetical protein